MRTNLDEKISLVPCFSFSHVLISSGLFILHANCGGSCLSKNTTSMYCRDWGGVLCFKGGKIVVGQITSLEG